MRRNPGRKIGEGTDRRAQHHAVGTFHRICRVDVHPVGDSKFHDPVEALLRARVDNDLSRDVTTLPRDACYRRTDQADTKQRKALEDWLSHGIAA